MTTLKNLVVGSEDTIETPIHKGTGLNDLTIAGEFTGTSETQFRLKISAANPASADEFSVSTDGGATYGSPITMDGTAQAIGSGLTAQFASKRGHTLNDLFDFRATGSKTLDVDDSSGADALVVNPDGSVAVSGALTLTGTLTANNIASAATGGADDITIDPAGVTALTIAEGGNVTAVGALAGSNLSGTNTGDQTITLTGAVTGSGTGSFATTLAASQSTTGSFDLTIDSDNDTADATFKIKKDAGTDILILTEAGVLQGTTFQASSFKAVNPSYLEFLNSSGSGKFYVYDTGTYAFGAVMSNGTFNADAATINIKTDGTTGVPATGTTALAVSQALVTTTGQARIAGIHTTTLPTADASTLGSLYMYRTGSGGTQTTRLVCCQEVNAAYAWYYLDDNTTV